MTSEKRDRSELRKVRKAIANALGFSSLSELADSSGINQGSLSRIVRGIIRLSDNNAHRIILAIISQDTSKGLNYLESASLLAEVLNYSYSHYAFYENRKIEHISDLEVERWCRTYMGNPESSHAYSYQSDNPRNIQLGSNAIHYQQLNSDLYKDRDPDQLGEDRINLLDSAIEYLHKKEPNQSRVFNVSILAPLEPVFIGSELNVCVEVSSGQGEQNNSFGFEISKHNMLDRELIFLLETSGFQSNSSSEVSLPFSSVHLPTNCRGVQFHLTAMQSGEIELSLEIYLDDKFVGRAKRVVNVRGFNENQEPIKKQFIFSRPISPPDLMLRVQGCHSKNSDHLNYRLVNFMSSDALDELPVLSKFMQVDLMGKFRRELSLIFRESPFEASQTKEQLAALSSLGQALFQHLLPQEIQDELQSLRRYSQLASLMILADQATWLPWEIMHDGQHFLGDQFILGRWPLEISAKRPYEFAIGSVKLAHYANVERPEMWLDLLEPPGSMPPSVMQQGIFEDLGLAEVLQGLHLVRQGESRNDLDERSDAPVAIQETYTAEGVEEQLRPGKLNLRRNRPVVSLGYLQNGHKELTNIETAWVPAFLRAGCSAFVGSLWSVRPEVEAAFISNFYSNLWAGNNLGLAFYKAKQMARVAVPESVDWLAYVLYGDPMARPYRPVEGRGYAVVEAVGHDLDQPVAAGSTLRFRASLRRKPPIWYENRLMDVTEALNFADLKVYIAASGIEVKPSDCIEMRRTPDGDYLGWFNLSIPSGLAGQTSLVQVHFEDGDDPIQSQRLTLKVAEA